MAEYMLKTMTIKVSIIQIPGYCLKIQQPLFVKHVCHHLNDSSIITVNWSPSVEITMTRQVEN